MSDSPGPTWPGSPEVADLVSRVVAERIDPLRSQLTTVDRALALLAERMPPPLQVGHLSGEVDARLKAQADDLRQAIANAVEDAVARIDGSRRADADRLLERITALEASLQGEGEARKAQTDELRQALGVALAHAVAKVDQARTADTGRLLEQVSDLSREAEVRQAQAEEFRQTVGTAIEQAVVWLETAITSDTARILERVSALEEPLERVAGARQTATDDLRTTINAALEQALARLEAARRADTDNLTQALARMDAARTADADRILELVAALEAPLQRDSEERRTQTGELRQALAVAVAHAVAKIDQARSAETTTLRSAVAEAIDRAIDRAIARLEADAQRRDEQARALLAAVDERLQSLHLAGNESGDAREARLVTRLEAVTAEHGRALAAAMVSSRDELLALANQALERSTALAAEVASASGTALDDLRASQTVLREVVQDSAHKAELAALDVRGLRDHLTPHLAALADATTRRAEADQAGFDAVLARLDQLLVVRQRRRPAGPDPVVSGG